MQKNRVLPKQCYRKAEEMMAAGLAPSQPGYVRADLFLAGFPCQPYSSQSRTKLDPTKHKCFPLTLLTIDYILLTRPRVALLENVVGFREYADYFGEERSGFDILRGKLDPLYHLGWSKLDLSVWLDCARPRLYMWLVAKDVGTVEECEAIGRQMHLLESSRPERLRARVEDFMFQCSSEEWRERVQLRLQCRGGLAFSRAPKTDTEGERKAEKHLLSLQRVEVGRLRGLQGTPRQRAMYQALVAARCADNKCDVGSAGSRADALEGFKWDFS